MFKVQLFCDVCRCAYVEGAHVGSRTATHTARAAARGAGWIYTKGVGWACARCIQRPTLLKAGQVARYTGTIITADGVKLNGLEVRILDVQPDTGTVHALFVDAIAGRYAQQAHWFFAHQFNFEVTEDVSGQEAKSTAADAAGVPANP